MQKSKMMGFEIPNHETVADRIAYLLPIYEKLNAATNQLVDQYVEDVAAPRCPGVPRAVIRALEVDNRVGCTMNYLEALRFLMRVRVP
jgi:hypothetical protein